MGIYYIDRETGEKIKEKVPGYLVLRWLYGSISGNLALFTLLRRKLFSRLVGAWQNLPLSRRKIKPFVEHHQINMSEAEISDINTYRTFNEFFIRRLKEEARPIDDEPESLAAPADGKLLAYQEIDTEKVVQIKGLNYSLAELLGDQNKAQLYQGGTKVIVRLAPADYHRFHFPDSGVIKEMKQIKGQYRSVSPIALEKTIRLYCQNKREITEIDTDHFGTMEYIEVGATCVGTIFQSRSVGDSVEKGEEKGYFAFGGSTVILFFQKDQVIIDEDLIHNTQAGIETKVQMGEKIGSKYKTDSVKA